MKLILEERGKQVIYDLGASEEAASVGRGLENTIPIRDPLASRRHVKIARRPGGEVTAEDLGSKNGTLLNGAPLRMAALRPGDCIQIGDVRIWYMERPVATPTPAPDAQPAPVRPPGPVITSGAELSAESAERLAASRTAIEPHAETRRRTAEDVRAALAADRAAPAAPPPPAPAAAAVVSEQPEATVRVPRAISAVPAVSPPPRSPDPDAPAAPPPGRFFLEGVEGDFVGKRYEIKRFPFRLGRSRKSALVLQDGGVSSEHCEIVPRGDGCAIVDLGSTNGTKMNGVRVKRAVLADGARIGVGANVFVFRDAGAARPGIGAPSKETEAPRVRAALVAHVRRPGGPQPAQPSGAKSDGPRGPGRTLPGVPAFALEEDEPADGAAPAAAPAALEDGELAGAAADLGRAAAEAGAAESAGRGRAIGVAAVALLGLALAAAGALFVASRAGPAADQAESDPPPRGSEVKNWSFEEVAPDGRIAGWTVRPYAAPGEAAEGDGAARGALATEAKLVAGGARAARLPAGEGPLEAVNTGVLILSGLDVQVRGMVAGGRSYAGLLVVWGSSRDAGFRLVSATDLAPRGAGFEEVRATFRPPPGADQARVALVGDGAAFDRITLAERGGSVGPAGGGRAEAHGLEARWDDRGTVALARDGWPVVDRATFALVGGGKAAALARAETALAIRPRGEAGPGIAGTLLAPSGDGAVGFEEVISAEGEALVLSYKLAAPVPEARPAVVLYLEDAGRGAALDLALAAGPATRSVPFAEDEVREVALGDGAEQVFFRPDAPVSVRAARLGAGLLVTIAAPPGAGGLSIIFGRGSARERAAVTALFEEAEGLRREGKLEAARRTFARIGRDYGHDAAIRERAGAAARALEARADEALAEAAAIDADIKAVRVVDLLAGAEERCRFIMDAYPDTRWATKAGRILESVARQRAELEGSARIAQARALLEKARAQLDGRRLHLARLALQAVLDRFGDVKECAAEARRQLDFVNKQIAEARP